MKTKEKEENIPAIEEDINICKRYERRFCGQLRTALLRGDNACHKRSSVTYCHYCRIQFVHRSWSTTEVTVNVLEPSPLSSFTLFLYTLYEYERVKEDPCMCSLFSIYQRAPNWAQSSTGRALKIQLLPRKMQN